MARNSENIAGAISAVNNIVGEQTEALAQIKRTLERKAAGTTDISLGITSAAVGDIVRVKAVDENGVPTEWEPSGGLQWYVCSDITTTEELTAYVVGTDENGVAIKDYNPVAIMLYCATPADETQTSANGVPWIYPSSTSSNANFRTIGSISGWKTTARNNTYIAFGSASGIAPIGFNVQVGMTLKLDPAIPYEMDGVRIYFNTAGDHFPVGTRFIVSVLGVKP